MSRPTVPVEPVRVGDRYERSDGAKVTITGVELHRADYSVLTEEGTIWSSHTPLPVPETWTKIASGPVPPEEKTWCVTHPLREAEPGQIFCPDCIDQVAGSWSKYAPDEAADLVEHLVAEQKGKS
jgi:hypothetical protein